MTAQRSETATIEDFADIRVGSRATLKRTITEPDLAAFAALSGDYNPLHMEAEFARQTSFQRRVAHGMLVGSYVSTLVGMSLPGPGALWTQQTFRWIAPVFIGDTLEITLEVTHKSEGTRTLSLSVSARNQNGKTVMEGEGSAVMLERRHKNGERSLCERLALVTGAAHGIGAAAAKALAEGGAAVVVNYRRSAAAAEELCASIQSGGGRALALQADVSQRQAVERMIATACEHFGQAVDVVVNSAGADLVPRAFPDLCWEEVERQMAVHVGGAFNCIQAVLPGMLAQNSGRIVNIGAAQSWNTPPAQWTAFLMAKSALKALTRSLAAELGPKGIRVNMVSPGLAETDFAAAIPERLRKVHAMQTPLRRLTASDDIARAIVFLCSAGGDFLTGIDLPVCGGSVM